METENTVDFFLHELHQNFLELLVDEVVFEVEWENDDAKVVGVHVVVEVLVGNAELVGKAPEVNLQPEIVNHYVVVLLVLGGAQDVLQEDVGLGEDFEQHFLEELPVHPLEVEVVVVGLRDLDVLDQVVEESEGHEVLLDGHVLVVLGNQAVQVYCFLSGDEYFHIVGVLVSDRVDDELGDFV